MNQIILADDRSEWMKAEDRVAACMRCCFFEKCSSRIGWDCKKLGGFEVPKIRGGSYEKEKPRYRKSKKRRV